MKLYSHTNFGGLFSTVGVDFRFFAYIEIIEIAKFVYHARGSIQTYNANDILFFVFRFDKDAPNADRKKNR